MTASRTLVITPPEPALSWDQIRQHLRIEADDERRPLAESLAAAATAHIDGPDGWLGRAIGRQELEARFDNFDCGSLRLPYPPIIEIVSVQYVTTGGNPAIIVPGEYELLGRSLVPAFGKTWPTPRWQREAVSVRYRAGYETVPAQLAVAIGIMTQRMFDGATAEEALAGPVEALLAPMRVFG